LGVGTPSSPRCCLSPNYFGPRYYCCHLLSELSSRPQPEINKRNHCVLGTAGEGQADKQDRRLAFSHQSSVPSARLLNRPARAGNNLINACRTSIVAADRTSGDGGRDAARLRGDSTGSDGRCWPLSLARTTINAFTRNCFTMPHGQQHRPTTNPQQPDGNKE